MDYNAATDELNRGVIHPLYLLYGSEDLLIKEFAAALRAKVLPTGDEWNYTRVDWPSDAHTVIGLCSTLPFMAERRLVVVQGASLFSPRRGKNAAAGADSAESAETAEEVTDDAASGDAAAWSSYFAAPNQSTALVFIAGEGVDRRTKLFKQIDKSGRAVECAQFRRQREITEWLRVRAADRGVKLNEDAASQMALSVAGGLQGLATELDKLATYAGKSGVIDRAAVVALVPRTAEVRIFDLIDAIAERRERDAVDLLAEALAQGEQPLKVTALLARQFRLAIQARVQVDQGANAARLADSLGLHPFVAEKLAKQCRRFSRDSLCRAMELLLAADVAIKTGRREPQLALEVLAVELMRLPR